MAYEAKERNTASARFCRNPTGRGFAGGLRCQARSEGNDRSRPRLSCIPSRKAAVAPAWDLFSDSIVLRDCLTDLPDDSGSGPLADAVKLMEMWNNCKIVTIKIGMEPKMDLEQTRYNMVEQQIRPWDVLDQKVLNLLFELRREEFVPAVYRSLAFVDMEIPLGYGEVMLAPKMEARILQELQIKKTDRILEVGSGSGYLTALLARQGEHVYSVEIVPELKAMAEKNLQTHDISNVTLEQGNAARGWPDHGPYDVIVLTGSTPVLPEAFQNNLKTGGRLFAVVGDAPVMEAILVTCVAQDKEAGVYNRISLFETCIPPLKNAQQPERFVF